MKKAIIVFLGLVGGFLYLSDRKDDKKSTIEKVISKNSQSSFEKYGNLQLDQGYFSEDVGEVSKNSQVSFHPISNKHCCQSLNLGDEQYIYAKIKENADKITSEVNPQTGYYAIEPIKLDNVNLDSFTVKKVIKALQWDNPGIFWLAGKVSFSQSQGGSILKLNSVVSFEEYKKCVQDLSDTVSKILSSMPQTEQEYERELYIHDWLVNNCTYDSEIKVFDNSSWTDFTVVGPLLKNKAVCEGYSKALKLLLCCAGIDSRLVSGSRKSERHMWNLVQINQNWYHVDSTWDAVSQIGRYNYFNLSDEIIKYDHTMDPEIRNNQDFSGDSQYNFNIPTCTSTQENYVYKNAIYIDSFDKTRDNYVISQLKDMASVKQRYMYVRISPSLDYETAVNMLFGQKPYKFFYYLEKMNEDRNLKNRIDGSQVYFSENKALSAVAVEVKYI